MIYTISNAPPEKVVRFFLRFFLHMSEKSSTFAAAYAIT